MSVASHPVAERYEPVSRRNKTLLAVGALALAGAVAVGHASPASGPELSIYRSTPLGFWVGAGVAMLVAAVVGFGGLRSADRSEIAGATLGVATMTAVAALPVVRSYDFYGGGDALTHLGWTKDIAGGLLEPVQFLYPGVHLVALFTSAVTDVPLTRSFMYVVLAFVIGLFVFVPLAVRAVIPEGGLVVGAFAAMLFLPVNHVATHYMSVHPITDAVLFSAVLLYALFAYVREPQGGVVSPFGLLLAAVLVAIVLYHPMQSMNVIVLLGGMAVAQFLIRRAEHPDWGGFKPLYPHAVFAAVVFAAWTLPRPRFQETVLGVATQVTKYVQGQTGAAGVVGQRGQSLGAIGASLPELFVKLFFPDAVFVTLTGLLILAALTGRLDDLPDVRELVGYGAGGLAVLAPFSLVFLVGNVSKLFFRNLGFMLLIATVFGAVAIRLAIGVADRRSGVLTGGVALVMLALVASSSMVVFPSPYIYQQNSHVTEGMLSGHQSAFELEADGTQIYGIRQGPARYREAIYGVEALPNGKTPSGIRLAHGVNASELRTLQSSIDGQGYVVIKRSDVKRELRSYGELRYSRASFQSVRRQPGVNRVLSNGAVTLYYVP